MAGNPLHWARDFASFVADVAVRWYRERIGDLAASVTFWLIISMPASVLALLAALHPLDRVINFSFQTTIQAEVESFIARIFTSEGQAVQETVSGLFNQTNTGLLTFSLLIAIWSISRGFAGLIRALEDIYDIEERRVWYHTRVVAVVLGFGSMLISVPLVMLEQLVWDQIPDGFLERSLRIMVAVLILILWASIIYHFGPAKRGRWRHDLPGAITAAVLWWLLTFGYGRYVSLTANANDVTAAVGAGLLALTWIWLAAQVLLIGGAVNYLYGERKGISRRGRSWTLNDVTGELKKIVTNGNGNGDGTSADTNGTTRRSGLRSLTKSAAK